VSDGTDAPIVALESALAGARLLGLELETRYRVLALTVEPDGSADPWGSGDGEPGESGGGDRGEVDGEVDRRRQLLFSPVSTVLASLRRSADSGQPVQVLTFTDDQLIDVAAAFGGAPLDTPLFGRPEPRPGSWAPAWSLEGRSTAGDGVGRTLTVRVRTDDGSGELALDLFARFDEVLVRGADGRDLERIGPRGGLGLGLDLGVDLGLRGGPVSRAPGTDATPPSSAASD
jgi:hypothetical protein